jgi:pilus assembly protein Flp/PilA
MKKLLNWLKDEESGQGMVEYALILGLIAVVVIGILTTMGTGISDWFTEINDTINPVEEPA